MLKAVHSKAHDRYPTNSDILQSQLCISCLRKIQYHPIQASSGEHQRLINLVPSKACRLSALILNCSWVEELLAHPELMYHIQFGAENTFYFILNLCRIYTTLVLSFRQHLSIYS